MPKTHWIEELVDEHSTSQFEEVIVNVGQNVEEPLENNEEWWLAPNCFLVRH